MPPNPLPPEIANLPPETPVQFESRGMEYDALTHEGITVMFAHLPPHIKDFSILQVTVTNGSWFPGRSNPPTFSSSVPMGRCCHRFQPIMWWNHCW